MNSDFEPVALAKIVEAILVTLIESRRSALLTHADLCTYFLRCERHAERYFPSSSSSEQSCWCVVFVSGLINRISDSWLSNFWLQCDLSRQHNVHNLLDEAVLIVLQIIHSNALFLSIRIASSGAISL